MTAVSQYENTDLACSSHYIAAWGSGEENSPHETHIEEIEMARLRAESSPPQGSHSSVCSGEPEAGRGAQEGLVWLPRKGQSLSHPYPDCPLKAEEFPGLHKA